MTIHSKTTPGAQSAPQVGSVQAGNVLRLPAGMSSFDALEAICQYAARERETHCRALEEVAKQATRAENVETALDCIERIAGALDRLREATVREKEALALRDCVYAERRAAKTNPGANRDVLSAAYARGRDFAASVNAAGRDAHYWNRLLTVNDDLPSIDYDALGGVFGVTSEVHEQYRNGFNAELDLSLWKKER